MRYDCRSMGPLGEQHPTHPRMPCPEHHLMQDCSVGIRKPTRNTITSTFYCSASPFIKMLNRNPLRMEPCPTPTLSRLHFQPKFGRLILSAEARQTLPVWGGRAACCRHYLGPPLTAAGAPCRAGGQTAAPVCSSLAAPKSAPTPSSVALAGVACACSPLRKGGRWSAEAIESVSQLARSRSRAAPISARAACIPAYVQR